MEFLSSCLGMTHVNSLCSVVDVMVCNVIREMLGRTEDIRKRNKRGGGEGEAGEKIWMNRQYHASTHAHNMHARKRRD